MTIDHQLFGYLHFARNSEIVALQTDKNATKSMFAKIISSGIHGSPLCGKGIYRIGIMSCSLKHVRQIFLAHTRVQIGWGVRENHTFYRFL